MKKFVQQTSTNSNCCHSSSSSLFMQSVSCGTLVLYGPFFSVFFWRTIGLRIKNLRNCDQEFVTPFNSNFHNKTLCESGVMWITRFVAYLSIAFHIYSPEKKSFHLL